MGLLNKSWFSKNLSENQSTKAEPPWYAGLQAYVQQPGRAVWTGRDYQKFAEEAYRKNVVANRAIGMIAQGVASVPYQMNDTAHSQDEPSTLSSLCHLLRQPNPQQSQKTFLEALTHYYLLGGNAYIHAVSPRDAVPRELHLLRPDRVHVIAGDRTVPKGYAYKVDVKEQIFPVHPVSGASSVLHVKHFNPMNDWYGMAPVEAASYSIDQHNQAAAWNQSLLQNGARPSGALVMKMGEGGGRLSEDQFWRLKSQVDEQFSGAQNAGRPLLLEGGLEWKEMSLNPRDMDFLNIKHSSARDIALAFGVPPQLLGIPGDNTYSNLVEARLALWEQTILPLAERLAESLQDWLNPMFGTQATLSLNHNAVAALATKREKTWERIGKADFLSDEEKRALLGLNAEEIV